jgi:glutaredoxin
MTGKTEIHIYTLPVCPKCKVMKMRIQEIIEQGNDVDLKESSLLSNPGFVFKNKVMDAPAMEINGQVVTGVISKDKILELISESA